ncbi:MAG: ribbon-helix-helix domain-containing protein [Streptomycetales bacterium]
MARTTIRIDDELLRKLKVRAAESGRTVGDLVEDAVRLALSTSGALTADLPTLPTYGGGGVLPGVDLASNAALRDAMEQGLPVDALR